MSLRTYVNNELRQEGNTRTFINDIPAIIEFITEFMTLEENDLILTGTPEGISHLYPGDVMRVEIDGIGALENPVVAERYGDGPLNPPPVGDFKAGAGEGVW